MNPIYIIVVDETTVEDGNTTEVLDGYFTDEEAANIRCEDLNRSFNIPHGLYDEPSWGYKKARVKKINYRAPVVLPF